MTPEEKEMLGEVYGLVKENNKILRSIQRMNRFSAVMRILYWVLIIGASFGAYYLIQPYIESISGTYNDAMGTVKSVTQDMQSVKGVLNTLTK